MMSVLTTQRLSHCVSILIDFHVAFRIIFARLEYQQESQQPAPAAGTKTQIFAMTHRTFGLSLSHLCS